MKETIPIHKHHLYREHTWHEFDCRKLDITLYFAFSTADFSTCLRIKSTGEIINRATSSTEALLIFCFYLCYEWHDQLKCPEWKIFVVIYCVYNPGMAEDPQKPKLERAPQTDIGALPAPTQWWIFEAKGDSTDMFLLWIISHQQHSLQRLQIKGAVTASVQS